MQSPLRQIVLKSTLDPDSERSTTDRKTYVKVTPSNQTLILASERGASGGFSTPVLRNAAGESTLQRVTIIASRPDDTLVYLQADYSTTTEPSARALPSPSSAADMGATLTALPARISLPAPRGNSYTSSRGVELYSSTQRMLAATAITRLDVLA